MYLRVWNSELIKFDNVTKIYGEKVALENVSFEISPGEFVFLVGTSGAGKSTIIKLLIREKVPTEGEITYEDIPVTQLKDKYVPLLRQEIGVVFQDFKLIKTKTVYENVAFGLEVLNFTAQEVAERVEKSLKLVGMSEEQNQFPSQLSGGEKQRVAIARSLALSPKVFIADEPTGNVDPTLTENIFQIFDKINKKGITVIIATHDKEEVDKMKKRVIELVNGKVVRDEKAGKYENSKK